MPLPITYYSKEAVSASDHLDQRTALVRHVPAIRAAPAQTGIPPGHRLAKAVCEDSRVLDARPSVCGGPAAGRDSAAAQTTLVYSIDACNLTSICDSCLLGLLQGKVLADSDADLNVDSSPLNSEGYPGHETTTTTDTRRTSASTNPSWSESPLETMDRPHRSHIRLKRTALCSSSSRLNFVFDFSGPTNTFADASFVCQSLSPQSYFSSRKESIEEEEEGEAGASEGLKDMHPFSVAVSDGDAVDSIR